MSIADAVLPEYDQEMASTRKMLERVPGDKAAWKPHDKSMGLGQLAIHLSDLPGWGAMTITSTEFDMNPPGGPGYQSPPFESTAALVAKFDDNVKQARAALAGASDADYMVDWSLKNQGQTIFTMPRVVVIRSFVLNHLIHHRGQLSVYLRLNGVPLPSLYGPTADEGNM